MFLVSGTIDGASMRSCCKCGYRRHTSVTAMFAARVNYQNHVIDEGRPYESFLFALEKLSRADQDRTDEEF
jgi:hypothetical protein